MEDGIIIEIKIGDKGIENFRNKCKYLFYELKADDDNEGGYKIELSFEDQQNGMMCCNQGLRASEFFGESQVRFGQNNQSILSTFIISNETLMEMRRMMTTKCTVDFNGTKFNVFKFVKLINSMKYKSAMAATGVE